MNTEFGKDHGLIHEAVITGRKVGADEMFWSALAHNEALFAQVVAFVAGALKPVFRLTSTINRDMTGWECVEAAQPEVGEFEPELVEFLREGESSVGGEEMIKRAREKGCLTGLRHAEAMLRQQDKIPVEWRKHCLVFSEVWLDPSRNRYAWYLSWGGERWFLCSRWLECDFNSSCRLVRSRK